MQLQVVAGRGGGGGGSSGGVGTPQYAQYARHQQAPRGYAVCASSSGNGTQQLSTDVNSGVKFTERGVPEGAASVSQTDGHPMMSPTANAQNCNAAINITGGSNVGGGGGGGAGMQPTGGTPPGAVFYAMNV